MHYKVASELCKRGYEAAFAEGTYVFLPHLSKPEAISQL